MAREREREREQVGQEVEIEFLDCKKWNVENNKLSDSMAALLCVSIVLHFGNFFEPFASSDRWLPESSAGFY